MGKTVEGVLSKQVRGSYRMHGQSGGRSSKYGSMGVPTEYIGRAVEVVNICPCKEQKQGRPGWLPQSPYEDNRN